MVVIGAKVQYQTISVARELVRFSSLLIDDGVIVFAFFPSAFFGLKNASN